MKPELYGEPKQKAKLQLWTSTPNTAYFEHDFGSYKLEARIAYNEAHDDPWILSVHGARGDYTKSDPVTLGLRDRGYSVLSFSMSGHSPAGVLASEETSLANNIAEAQAFFQYLDPHRPKVLIGYSLGGTPVLKTLERHLTEVDKVALFYPGIYSADAYDKHYGEPLRQAISEAYSYRRNDTIEVLRQFKGGVLLVKGEYDGLDPIEYGKPAGGSAGQVQIAGKTYSSPIPKEVIEMIRDIVPAEHFEYFEVPKCDHLVMGWMREHPDRAEWLLQKLDAFLQS
jgi:pimeloyl-ACP methyl ester carboxylesterase